MSTIEQKVNLIQLKIGAIDELAAKKELEETKNEIIAVRNEMKEEVENIKAMINEIKMQDNLRKIAKSEMKFEEFFLKKISTSPLEID